jgi:hypothetical protein
METLLARQHLETEACDELLNDEILCSLKKAQIVIDCSRQRL